MTNTNSPMRRGSLPHEVKHRPDVLIPRTLRLINKVHFDHGLGEQRFPMEERERVFSDLRGQRTQVLEAEAKGVPIVETELSALAKRGCGTTRSDSSAKNHLFIRPLAAHLSAVSWKGLHAVNG